jgi:hypothetical protein
MASDVALISKFYIPFINCRDFKQGKVSVQWSEDRRNRVRWLLRTL